MQAIYQTWSSQRHFSRQFGGFWGQFEVEIRQGYSKVELSNKVRFSIGILCLTFTKKY